MRYILTFDIGTTAVKTCLFDEVLRCVSSANEEYQLLTGQGNTVELDPETYIDACRNGIRATAEKEGLLSQVAAVCITTQGETLIPIDEAGKPLSNAIVWLDTRAEEEAAFIKSLPFAADLFQKTGIPTMEATTPLAKLLWIKNHQPEIYEKTAKFLLLEDYIIYRATDIIVTEKVLMGTTGYYDIRNQCLYREALEQTGIDANKIPEIVDSGTVVGKLTKYLSLHTGLPEGIPVVAGAMDQVAAAIGGGNLREGVVTETTGTCMSIMTSADQRCFGLGGNVCIYPHVLPDKYYIIPFCMTAGVVLKWFKDEFCTEETKQAKREGRSAYKGLDDLAATCPPGAGGLLLIPYLNGILQPESKPEMRGVFFGISLDTKKPQFIRAIFEGVGYMLRENLELIERMGIEVKEIRSFGGGSNSVLWQQIKSDITWRKISTMHQTECASLGAAILAAVAIGLYPDLDTAAKVNTIARSCIPDPAAAEVYNDLYARYLRVLEASKALY
jgi:xylulokinase